MPRPLLTLRTHSRRLSGAVLPIAVVAALIAGSAPARADSTAPSPQAPEATGSTSQDVAAQTSHTSQLQQQADSAQDKVSAAEAALQATSVRAGAALEAYTTAVRALDAAQLTEAREQATYAASQQRLDAGRDQLGRWARAAYTNGSPVGGDGLVATILTARTTDALASDMVVMSRLGDERAQIVRGYASAQAAQATAKSAAEQAAVQAADAAVAAASAKDAANVLVANQKTVLADARRALADTQDQLARSQQDDQARALAAATATASSVRAGGNAITGPVGDCPGQDVSSYPNGQIPVSALCPLWGTTNHRLRADAANAFNQMSQAYAAHFGTPICVTDSYRTLAVQIALKKSKPNLAATPGTSNHGWGTATDLCGGIQNFGTEQHNWLLVNAPLYGWFHPAWAQATGSKPEPWHWEYSG